MAHLRSDLTAPEYIALRWLHVGGLKQPPPPVELSLATLELYKGKSQRMCPGDYGSNSEPGFRLFLFFFKVTLLGSGY